MHGHPGGTTSGAKAMRQAFDLNADRKLNNSNYHEYNQAIEKWDILMINVVIPMAGKGQRFLDKGILTPKPLLKVNSEPFIAHVIDTVSFEKANFYFLIREQHLVENNFEKIFKEKKINYKIITIKEKRRCCLYSIDGLKRDG